MLDSVPIISGSGFAEKRPPALHGECFAPGLAPRSWTIRQSLARRSHLLLIESRRGTASLRGSAIAFAAPALLWLPGDHEGSLQIEAGTRGYLLSVSDDFLTRTVAGSAEALPLRRTIDRLVLLQGAQLAPSFDTILASCNTLTSELSSPGRGTMTMMSSHVLLLCLQLWRAAIPDDDVNEAAQRGGGPRLVGNFLQMVELHYRDGWTIARYAAALGVTEDRLHAHCKREKGCSPRAIIHQRLIHEACARLRQLDLPVEQIGYGLGFRDPGYFSRFFRKHQNASPGAYRRRARLDASQHGPSYAAWP